VILIKLDGDLFALDSVCPHGAGGHIQTGPLEQGRFALCPLHRYPFDPKTGRAEGVACRSARRYRVTRRGDDAEIFV
jgi:nitrite reductase/ring-hydroxylating ferredoxin subunit